jgi:hypothetical protein
MCIRAAAAAFRKARQVVIIDGSSTKCLQVGSAQEQQKQRAVCAQFRPSGDWGVGMVIQDAGFRERKSKDPDFDRFQRPLSTERVAPKRLLFQNPDNTTTHQHREKIAAVILGKARDGATGCEVEGLCRCRNTSI